MSTSPFRIAFIGSHSTGKTTLLTYFEEMAPNLRILSVKGITRRLMSEGFPMGKNAVLDSWMRYVDEQLRAERLLAVEPHDLFFSDRTVLDAAAYAAVNRALPRPYIPEYFASMLYEIAILEAKHFDLFAYFPIEFDLVRDGVRDDDDDYRSAVDFAVRSLLEESALDFVMLTGTVEERFSSLVARLPTGIATKIGSHHLKGETRLRHDETSEPPPPQAKAEERELAAAGYSDILDSILFNRLEGVSFLGVLDYVYRLPKSANRREHSIGAAHTALQLARRLGMTGDETDVFVLANLLHDVGHGPFSHNSEPFLVESRNVYHYGLLTTYLRHGTEAVGEDYSITNLLKHRSSGLREAVGALLMKRASVEFGWLQILYSSPLNCDKIDGNHRTLRLLGMEAIDPEAVIGCFLRTQSGVFVREDSLDLIEHFWTLEAKLYWERIYTLDVFGAEAMLTKAFSLVFGTEERVTAFAVSTDDEVIDRMRANRQARRLFGRIEANELFVPLSKIDPHLYESVRAEMAPARFDRRARDMIERRIADKLGIGVDGVISHYSRRKHFSPDVSQLRQRPLFGGDPDMLSLAEINRHLTSNKLSGDLFEVFCDVPQSSVESTSLVVKKKDRRPVKRDGT